MTICPDIAFSLTYTDTTAIDPSVFTFYSVGSPKYELLTGTTNDAAKVKTYNFELNAKFVNPRYSQFVPKAFDYEITCGVTSLTAPSVPIP